MLKGSPHVWPLLAALGLVACSSGDGGTELPECTCDVGSRCDADDVCRTICANDAECGAGLLCVSALCQPWSGSVRRCGDAIVDPGESCDDGFRDACGSCNVDCTGPGSGASCGDGLRCDELEACDDGFTDGCGSCNADCSAAGAGAVCGDGVQCDELEACDDGFADACGSCDSDCTAAGSGSFCGDGAHCPEFEACDDGFRDACGGCDANCTASGTGSTCGDGFICPETETCEEDEAEDCGACNASCDGPGDGSLCGSPCADETVEQTFSATMFGCAGSVTWASRKSLCGANWVVCPAAEWPRQRGGVAPTHNYWTHENLRYGGAAGACSASLVTGLACASGMSINVCTAAGTDAEGNSCNWENCGYATVTPNQYFGGCSSTAGALCCAPTGCADGTIEQTFPTAMVGCGGSVTFPNRATLCANGYHVCSPDEWSLRRGIMTPSLNYWTDANLGFSGVEGACSAMATGGMACPTNQPMRVCAATTDALGNTCTWVNCGFGANTPNQYFGGCTHDPLASTLCCID